MRLRRLRVRRFRRLRGLEITFHPGLNVIVGPNEAGKSTLREAIIMALYGNAATTSQAIRESTRSWGSDRPAVLELEFEADGEVYTLGKDFHGRKVFLRDSNGRKVFLRDSKGNNWEGHARIQREIGTLLGFPNENLYRSTAHVAQAELDRLSTDTPDIAKELSRIITGGGQDANVVTVLHRLEQAIEAQRKGLQRYAKDPGPIKRLENIVTSLEGRRAELLQKAQQAIQSRKEIIEVSKELERAATTLTIKDNLLKVNQELMRVENRLQELKTQESQLGDRIRKIHQNILKLSQIKEEIAALIGEGEVPDEETMHKLRETYAFYSGAASRAERLAEEVRAMEGSLAQFPRFAGRAVSALLTLATVSLIASMVLSAWRGIVWGGLTALPGVLFLLFAYNFSFSLTSSGKWRRRDASRKIGWKPGEKSWRSRAGMLASSRRKCANCSRN